MRILIADKDANLRALVAARLAARRYEVIEAVESEEALHYLNQGKVDLILLSTAMERMGGKPLIELIRQRPHLTTIPIILLTEDDKLADLVLSKDRGFDDFLTKPFNPLVLHLRIELNITRAARRIDANALTHLPGNHAIDRVIWEKIQRREKFSVLYLDINHFKSFNDLYGFEKGDEVICRTAKMLMQIAEGQCPEKDYFIGHVGGDDFLVVLKPEEEEAFARVFIAEFDRIIPGYYNKADQKRGFIRVVSRRGKRETFPLLSCSVAAVNNLHRDYKNLGEIARDAAEVKAFLKSQPGSHYLRDRRSAPLRGLKEAMDLLTPELGPHLSATSRGGSAAGGNPPPQAGEEKEGARN